MGTKAEVSCSFRKILTESQSFLSSDVSTQATFQIVTIFVFLGKTNRRKTTVTQALSAGGEV